MGPIKQALLRRLADGGVYSGEALARELGISRAAIWKQLKAIEETWGVGIDSLKGKGYRLTQPLELLETARLFEHLSPAGARGVTDILLHDSLDSTNSWLMARVADGLDSGTICLAEHQSAGRGRHGRQWVSPFGSNIYLSLLWRYPLAPVELAGLSLACGVAVARALGRLGGIEPTLKWPNDILWRRRKLAGLLLEVGGESTGPCYVVAGVGLNVQMPKAQSEAINQPWVDLASIEQIDHRQRNRIAATLIDELVRAMTTYGESGLSAFLADWTRHDHFKGEEVLLSIGPRDIRGLYQGIAQDGSLCLQVEGRPVSFNAGEVSLCRAAD